MQESKIMYSRDLAEYLGIALPTLQYRMAYKPQSLPSPRRMPEIKRPYWLLHEVEEWLSSHPKIKASGG